MRKAFLTIFAILFLASSALAAQGKIGVVNMPRVIAESEAGKEARGKLQDTFQPMQEDIDRQKAELEKMRSEMQSQSLVLSQQAKIDKEEEFKRRVRDLQDAMQSFQRKYKMEESQISQPIIKMILETMQAWGEKNGYSVIFDGKGAGVLYVADPTNVTNEIIVEVNKAWRAQQK